MQNQPIKHRTHIQSSKLLYSTKPPLLMCCMLHNLGDNYGR